MRRGGGHLPRPVRRVRGKRGEKGEHRETGQNTDYRKFNSIQKWKDTSITGCSLSRLQHNYRDGSESPDPAPTISLSNKESFKLKLKLVESNYLLDSDHNDTEVDKESLKTAVCQQY